MIDAFRTIDSPATSRLNEKRSRFLGHVIPVSTVDEAAEALAALRRATHDATHHCSAYRLLDDDEIHSHADDDGEPSGSAGLPILQQLEKAALVNVLAVVIRYYGGAKLGVGGLVRAYGAAIAEALAGARIVTRCIEVEVLVRFDPHLTSTVMSAIHRHPVKEQGIEYDREAQIRVTVAPSQVERFVHAVRDATGARAHVEVSY